MDPPESQVAMAVGESRNFTCRMTCADGRAASVLWRGLDTSLGAVQSSAGLSVLYVINASLSAAGTRVCVGSCGDVVLQHRVRLLVFGEPPPLPPPLRTRGPGRQPCFPFVPWPPPPGTFPGLPTTSPLIAASQVLQSCSAVPVLRASLSPIHPRSSRTSPPAVSALDSL